MLYSDTLAIGRPHWWPVSRARNVRQSLLCVVSADDIWPLDIGPYVSLRACSYVMLLYADEIKSHFSR